MKKSKFILPVCSTIFIATYLLVVFLTKKEFNTGFWVSLAFVVVAYLIMDFALMYTRQKHIKSQVVGLPVSTMSVMYFALELVMGTVFMFVNVSFLAYFLPQIIVFALFLMCFVLAMLSDNNYKSQNNENQEK